MRRWITKVMKEGNLKRRGGREGEEGGGERVTRRRYEGSRGKGRSNGRSREISNLSVRRLREVHQ